MNDAIAADEVLAVLHAVERGEVTVSCPDGLVDLGHVEFVASNGWRFVVYIDAGTEWDYIEAVETADGRAADLWTFMADPAWRDCPLPAGPERDARLDKIEARDGLRAVRDYEPPDPRPWGCSP